MRADIGIPEGREAWRAWKRLNWLARRQLERGKRDPRSVDEAVAAIGAGRSMQTWGWHLRQLLYYLLGIGAGYVVMRWWLGSVDRVFFAVAFVGFVLSAAKSQFQAERLEARGRAARHRPSIRAEIEGR